MAAELSELAWGYAMRAVSGAGDGPAQGSAPGEAPSVESLRRNYLELLRVYSAMTEALAANIRGAQGMAHTAGASYSTIADARGVSRQAVRQQWIRQRSKRIVTLEGGPRNGEEATVLYSQELQIWIDRSEWTEIAEEFRGATVTYRQSKVDRDRYVLVNVKKDVLQHFERLQEAIAAHHKQYPEPWEIALQQEERPRVNVHELAHQVLLPTNVVLGRLAAMGVIGMTASSTVENSTAAVIRRAAYRTSDWD